MQFITHPFLRAAGLLTSAVLGLSSLHAADAVKPAADKDPLPVFENSFTLAGQYNGVKGNEAAFQEQNWTAKNGFGGIQDFQFAQDLKNDVSVKADGHALFGNEDYLAHINLSKNEVGAVDVGFKRFRTYYDNAGGFFLPTASAWPGLIAAPEAMYIDRSKFWVNASLVLPNAPVVSLRYTNELRNGSKDSTIWGASDFTGLTGSTTAATLASRFIAPNYIQIGERQQTLEALAQHSLGNTTFSLNLQGSRSDLLNTRFFDRYPGQLALPPFTVGGDIRNRNNQISGYQQQGNQNDTVSTTAKVETVLSDNARIHAGFRYQLSNVDFTEQRPLYTQTPFPTAAPVGFAIDPDANIYNLAGGAKVAVYTATIGSDLKIGRDLFVEVGLKAEDRYTKVSETYQTLSGSVNNTTGVVTVAPPANRAAASRVKEKSLTPEIGLRYVGFRNLSLYGNAESKILSGEDRIYAPYDFTTVSNPVPSNNDIDENHDRYSIGANWEPLTAFSLRTELFYKDHKNDFQNAPGTSTAVFRLGYELKGVKVTATVTPIAPLSFTSRYIYQTGEMTTATATRATYQSGDITIHQFGETINWNPVKQFYMQGDLNVVFDTTSTAYPRAGGAANDALHNADNNYWTGSILAGFVVDKVTNAEIQYTYYKADNYDPSRIPFTVAYGASQTDYSVTVGAKRKLTDKLIAEAKLGYLSSKNDTTGGRTDYSARVAYVSLTQAF